jgi:hypothetical protein
MLQIFEYWLHPSTYRTQLCKDGAGCQRRVCFFAHSLKELTTFPSSSSFPSSAVSVSAAVPVMVSPESATVSSSGTAALAALAASLDTPDPAPHSATQQPIMSQQQQQLLITQHSMTNLGVGAAAAGQPVDPLLAAALPSHQHQHQTPTDNLTQPGAGSADVGTRGLAGGMPPPPALPLAAGPAWPVMQLPSNSSSSNISNLGNIFSSSANSGNIISSSANNSGSINSSSSLLHSCFGCNNPLHHVLTMATGTERSGGPAAAAAAAIITGHQLLGGAASRPRQTSISSS